MGDQDREALFDLAADMTWVDAAKFIRAELGCGLREAAYVAERIAKERPDSPIHKSFYRTNFAPMQPSLTSTTPLRA